MFRIKSWSLVTKLMVLYSLSTIAILTAVLLFLYPTFEKYINISENVSALCFQKIIISLLLSVVAAILFGNIIARNGLNKIREFANKMETITANSLHEKINSNEWPNELRNLGMTFNTMLDRINTSFIQLSQFSSDIAHELRNPIHNLRGTTEVALSKNKSVEQYKQVLESHIEEYEYLTKLIETLLFLARSDQGQIKLNKKLFHVREEIVKIISYFQAIADENNITFLCEGDALIFVDDILFKRVINNLISNALRYTPKKGMIRISIHSCDNKSTNISISDNGTGMSSEHLPKIFDRFYRADSSRSSQSGGLGLGLALVKSIMDLHKGKITIESQLNLGTSIHLVFYKD